MTFHRLTSLATFLLLALATAVRADGQPPLVLSAPDQMANLPPAPTSSPSPSPSGLSSTPNTPDPITHSPEPAPPDKTAAPTSPVLVRSRSLRDVAAALKLPLPLPTGRIIIEKSRRRLLLYNGQELVKTYKVALGPHPAGPKQRQSDGRTPEGQFYICTHNSSSTAFHIFLGLSYPALPDATRAVNTKVINWREFQLIRERLASRGAPLWRTRLGGWVGIHGGTDHAFAQRKMWERHSHDWTAGCVGLTDAEIDEIAAATRIGTSVLIRP